MNLGDRFKSGVSVLAQMSASWLNEVGARVSNIIGCQFIRVTIPDRVSPSTPVKIGINFNELDKTISNLGYISGRGESGTPKTIGSFPTEVGAKSYTWTAGGANGVNVHILAEGQEDGGTHQLYDAVLHFNKDGVLVSISNGTGGIDIMG